MIPWDMCCTSIVVVIIVWAVVELMDSIHKRRTAAEVAMFEAYVDTVYSEEWII